MTVYTCDSWTTGATKPDIGKREATGKLYSSLRNAGNSHYIITDLSQSLMATSDSDKPRKEVRVFKVKGSRMPERH